MKGVLLAAGFGTRLWPLSDVLAKPAFPFFDKPLVRHVADLLVKHGATALWANTHYLPETVHASFAGFDRVPVSFVHEDTILGTAGALVNMRQALEGDEPVVVMNAKVVTDIDLTAALVAHQTSGAPVTMVCIPNRAREKFTHVDFDAQHHLLGFVDGAQLTTVHEPYLFTGIQILSREFFAFLPPPGFSDTVKEVYPRIMQAGRFVNIHVSHERWAEFSTVARYRDLHLAERADGFIAPDARIDPSAKLSQTLVWAGASIGADVRLEGCIVADGVCVPDGFHARDKVIIQGARVREHKPEAVQKGELLVAPIA